MFQLWFTVNVSAVGKSISYSLNKILSLYHSFIILFYSLCQFVSMLAKHEFILKMFMAVCWSHYKCLILIVCRVDHSKERVWIFSSFLCLKNWLVLCNLLYIYFIQTNQTCRTLLEKQRRAHKWCTPMDPSIWPSKSRMTSSNIHTAAMWGYRM